MRYTLFLYPNVLNAVGAFIPSVCNSFISWSAQWSDYCTVVYSCRIYSRLLPFFFFFYNSWNLTIIYIFFLLLTFLIYYHYLSIRILVAYFFRFLKKRKEKKMKAEKYYIERWNEIAFIPEFPLVISLIALKCRSMLN